MFMNGKNRYMTKSIAEEIHPEIVLILWRLIDSKRMQNVELDYLQVFELNEQDGKQVIIHRQEIPKMKSLLICPLQQAKPIKLTIWCIDSGEFETMLLPKDY